MNALVKGAVRVALIADLAEERWPSMDLVADHLFDALRGVGADALAVQRIRPTFPSRGRTLGRYVNRYWDYSRWLRSAAGDFDVFHVIDHTYAHLVHVLPAARTIVTCHDIDAFMPVLAPGIIRSRLPKAVTRWVLSGMQKAAHVTCDSQATLDEVRQFRLVDDARVTVVHNGIDTGLTANAVGADDLSIDQLIGARDGRLEILHVGTTIPRKRIDVLLRVLAEVKQVQPDVRLLKAGGRFTLEQEQQIAALGLDQQIVQLPFLDRPTLSALYRRAQVVLLTSDREGFGLPLAEALACGTPAIATDLPVFREVGGAAARYVMLDDIGGWRDEVVRTWRDRHSEAAAARRRLGLEQAARFTWPVCAAAMARLYGDVAARAARS